MRDSFVPIAYRSHRSVLSSGLNGGLGLVASGLEVMFSQCVHVYVQS